MPVMSAAAAPERRPSAPARAQVAHHPDQVAVAAEGHHEGDVIAEPWPPGGDDRQAAREADADHADLAVGREVRRGRRATCAASSSTSVFSGVMRNCRRSGGATVTTAIAGGGEILGHADQPRLVDAVHVHARREQHRARERCAGRIQRAPAPRRGAWRSAAGRCASPAARATPRCAREAVGEVGGADDERGGVDVGQRDDRAGNGDRQHGKHRRRSARASSPDRACYTDRS